MAQVNFIQFSITPFINRNVVSAVGIVEPKGTKNKNRRISSHHSNHRNPLELKSDDLQHRATFILPFIPLDRLRPI